MSNDHFTCVVREVSAFPFSGGVSLKEVFLSGGRLHLYCGKMKNRPRPGVLRKLRPSKTKT